MWFFRRPEKAVLLVCTANICRSPMAEGILRAELQWRGLDKRVKVDSAGTHASQIGHRVDARALQICAREGIDLVACRARQVKERDFSRFDYILAMDLRNYEWLLAHCPEPCVGRLTRVGNWVPENNTADIPDPYYGNLAGFEQVFEMLRGPINALVERLEGELPAH